MPLAAPGVTIEPDSDLGASLRLTKQWSLRAAHSQRPFAEMMRQVAVSLDSDLIVVNPEGRILAALDVKFRTRVTAGDQITVVGADSTDAIKVTALVSISQRTLLVNLAYEAPDVAFPEDLYRIFRLLHALHPPNRMAMRIGGHPVGEPAMVPEDAPEFPAEHVEAARSLAFVQSVLRQRHPMPWDLTDDDLRTIRTAESLIRGDLVRSRWRNASLGLDELDETLAGLAEDAGEFRLEFVAPVEATIGGTTIRLGDVHHTFEGARIVEPIGSNKSPDGLAQLQLVPGHSDALVQRLMQPLRPIASAFDRAIEVSAETLRGDGKPVTAIGRRRPA
jgi:hypothetical protein